MDHGVPRITRSQEMSCWAASAAMTLSWHSQASYTEQSVLDHFPEFGSDGVDVAECLKLSQELETRRLSEACRVAEAR